MIIEEINTPKLYLDNHQLIKECDQNTNSVSFNHSEGS